MATMPALPAGAEDYDTGDGFDEAFEAPGVVREHYLEVLESLAETGVEHAAQAVEARLREWSVRFGGEGDGAEFVVDPVPRLLTAEEWKELTTGLRQRVLALDAFVADMHGPRRAIADGVIPARVVEGSVYLEDDLRGLEPVGGARIAIAGLDVVRDRDGRFKVLEDNVRTPSGSAYGLAASEAVEAAVPTHARHEAAAEWLRTALRHCMEATNPDVEGELVLLTDGPGNSAWYEHKRLAEVADLRLVQPDELRRRGGRLEVVDGAPVRAVYRRTDEDRLRDEDGQLTYLAELLLEPLRSGTIGLVNWFGNGVADDKRVYPYVDDLVRLYLGEEPHLTSVPTYDLVDETAAGRRARPPRRARAQAARRARRGGRDVRSHRVGRGPGGGPRDRALRPRRLDRPGPGAAVDASHGRRRPPRAAPRRPAPVRVLRRRERHRRPRRPHARGADGRVDDRELLPPGRREGHLGAHLEPGATAPPSPAPARTRP